MTLTVVVDVWGGPDCPPNVMQARSVHPVQEALRWIEHELREGHVVNCFALPAGCEPPAVFDFRVQGHA